MTYRAPINDMLLSLNHGAGLAAAVKAGHYGDFDADITTAVLEEAGKFATDRLAPLNRVGDEHGIKLSDGKVTTAPGWPDAYQRWAAAGWNAVSGPEAFGGQGLPLAINAACTEIWSASNIAFGLCPLLTLSAIEALDAHGSEALKQIYLEKLVSGEWTGTMVEGQQHVVDRRAIGHGGVPRLEQSVRLPSSHETAVVSTLGSAVSGAPGRKTATKPNPGMDPEITH